jgi:hypothetical protein
LPLLHFLLLPPSLPPFLPQVYTKDGNIGLYLMQARPCEWPDGRLGALFKLEGKEGGREGGRDEKEGGREGGREGGGLLDEHIEESRRYRRRRRKSPSGFAARSVNEKGPLFSQSTSH